MSAPETRLDATGHETRRPQIVRTALLLAGVALMFYIGFIAIGIIRS